jgi:DNA-binding NarL/FixJ family response regulator
MSGRPITVAIVEDDTGFRESLRLLIEAKPGYLLAGTFGSTEDALEGLVDPAPDVLLLDIRLPGESGSRAVRRFKERFPALVVLMLTLYSDDGHVFEALCNGASGYLLKRTPASRILEAVREVFDGGAPMSPEIAKRVVEVFRRFPNPASAPAGGLTSQELRFLSLLAKGYSYQAAADALEVSINTVRKYVRAVYDKLHVHSRSEAVAKGLSSGLI